MTDQVPAVGHEEDTFINISPKRLIENSIIDESEGFSVGDIPLNPLNYLILSSPVKSLGTSLKRLFTEGRSVSFFEKEGIKDSATDITYYDVLVKGIGGGIRQLTRKTGEFINRAQKRKREIVPRYVAGELKEISGKDFGVANYNASGIDAERSEAFAEKGLRTRKRIFVAKLKAETKIATDKGLESIEDTFRQDETNYPAIEMWVMRCSYRVRDIFSSMRTITDSAITFSSDKLKNYAIYIEDGKIEFNNSMLRSSTENLSENTDLEDYFNYFKDLVISRVETDEDDRFRELAELKDLDSRKFIKMYLDVFGSILGEQVGLMHHLGIFIKSDMFNSQNISILAEIVDFDVAEIKPEFKEKPKKVMNQVLQSYTTYLELINNFYLVGVIDKRESLDLLDRYIDGFKLTLSRNGELAQFQELLKEIKYEVFNEARIMDLLDKVEETENEIQEYRDEGREGKLKELSRKKLKRFKNDLKKERMKVKLDGIDKPIDQRKVFDDNGGGILYLLKKLQGENTHLDVQSD